MNIYLSVCSVLTSLESILKLLLLKKKSFFLINYLSTTQLFAQDKIYKLKGTVINAKVIEIGTDEIKYKLFDSPDGPIYVVDKSTLNRIEFADGRVEKYKLSYKDPQNYEGQLSKAIKINFLAPLLGYSQFSFEKSISPLKSYELGLGIIGAGKITRLMIIILTGSINPIKEMPLVDLLRQVISLISFQIFLIKESG